MMLPSSFSTISVPLVVPELVRPVSIIDLIGSIMQRCILGIIVRTVEVQHICGIFQIP